MRRVGGRGWPSETDIRAPSLSLMNTTVFPPMFSGCDATEEFESRSCVYVCVYVYMYVCICVCMYVYAYEDDCVSVDVFWAVIARRSWSLAAVCMCVCIYVCM
jgi:hypothetical protein